jgi:hypothetical protein
MGKKARETRGEDVDKRQVLRVLLSFLWPTTLLDKFLALLIRPGGVASSGLLANRPKLKHFTGGRKAIQHNTASNTGSAL